MFNRMFKSNRGTSVIFFALLLVFITGMAAISLDVGDIVVSKSRLSSALDSAALSGAQEMVTNNDNARNLANSYLLTNLPHAQDISVTIDESYRQINISASLNVEYYFGKIFGLKGTTLSDTAKARVENIKSLTGARPFAIVQQTFTYGKLYPLKEGAGDGTSGNYAALALGGSGSSNYANNLLNGYPGKISVGDLIETETGNMSGTTSSSINTLIGRCNHIPACTYQDYNVHCPRIIQVPIVDTLDVNGKKYVKVVGFGTFFLEGCAYSGGHADVKGRFITYCMEGETSNSIGDFGTYGIKLIR